MKSFFLNKMNYSKSSETYPKDSVTSSTHLPIHQDAEYQSQFAQVVLTGSFGGGASYRSLQHYQSAPSGKGYFNLKQAYGCPRK
jgi:hypothetical protein